MVSATMLSSYLYCPRKLFISSVLKIKEPPKEELVKGKIWHQTYEFINKNDESIVKSIKTSNYQEIYAFFRKNYARFLRNAIIMNKTELKEFNIKLIDIFKDYWENFDSEAKLRALNLSQFILKHNIFGEELWIMLEPKIISEQYFKSEKLNLSGIIDMIEVYKDFHVPGEIKTGKVPNKGIWDNHRVQLAAYMMLLEDSGKKTGEGYMKYKGIEEKRILAMNPMLKEEVIDLIRKVNIIISGFDAPDFVDNKNKCNKCQVKDTCYNEAEMNRLNEEVRRKSTIA